jgi:hypothetical protein
VWELGTRRLAADVAIDAVYDVDFDPVSGDLITCQDKGVLRWSFQSFGDDGQNSLIADAARPLDPRLNVPVRKLDISADGQLLIADRHHVLEALFIRRSNPEDTPITMVASLRLARVTDRM